MKKRILSTMLASVLLFSLVVPGSAAESGGSADRLAAVTGKVKSTLALDTEEYKEFSGQLTEGELAPTWRLNWSGPDGSLEITASESGRILSCYRYDGEEDQGNAPLSLPKSDPAKAKAAAEAFLKRVLGPKETAKLNSADQADSLGRTRYYFQGTILLNGCPSPLCFSIAVRTSDYAVTRFYRDGLEASYIGAVPAASFRTRQSAAESLLRDTLSLRLEYVLDEGEQTAVLRYLPNPIHNFYVDDASGKLVDLTKLYEEMGESGSSNGRDEGMEFDGPTADKDMAGGSGLTQAEQLGADKLKGTLNKEALDQKARAISPLGLDSYALASASYQEEQIDGASVIIARLTYAKRAEEKTFRRWVTLDAKTGELMAVGSSGRWEDGVERKVDEDTARKTAEDFLTARQKERFALCGAYTEGYASKRENGRNGIWSFQYARKENGYFFPQDQFTIGIDAVDGSVSSYAQSWTKDVKFDSPDGVVTAEQAVSAYFETFQVTKGYVAVPQKLDLSDADLAPLAEMGYRALNSLKLGWQLTVPDKNATGIDAKTGQPIFWSPAESGAIQYSDLAGSGAQKAAETLANYGIGYAGGKFRPDEKLTQLDLAALLASSQGVLVDPDNLADGDADQVYRTACSLGALRREERNDGKLLSRMDVIRILLDAGGYRPAAQLQGIYRTDFSDESEIPEGMLGYAALAQAMDVARADGAGRLNPGQSATRADAAAMLLAFMERA